MRTKKEIPKIKEIELEQRKESREDQKDWKGEKETSKEIIRTNIPLKIKTNKKTKGSFKKEGWNLLGRKLIIFGVDMLIIWILNINYLIVIYG